MLAHRGALGLCLNLNACYGSTPWFSILKKRQGGQEYIAITTLRDTSRFYVYLPRSWRIHFLTSPAQQFSGRAQDLQHFWKRQYWSKRHDKSARTFEYSRQNCFAITKVQYLHLDDSDSVPRRLVPLVSTVVHDGCLDSTLLKLVIREYGSGT
jgi:hypothetical protein